MSRRGPLINSRVLPLFLLAVRERGGDVARLAGQFHLPASLVGEEEVTLPLGEYREITEQAAEAAQDPFLGLNLGKSYPRGRFGLAEFICRSAVDLRGAVQQMARYDRLISDGVTYAFEERPGAAYVEQSIPGDPLCLGRQVNEFTVAYLLSVARDVTRTELFPEKVWLAHKAPPDKGPLEAWLGSAIRFGAGCNRIYFSPAQLTMPFSSADSALHQFLDKQGQKALAAMPRQDDFVGRVRTILESMLRTGDPTAERVGQAMHMSARTLQRRLAESDTTFQHVLDDVRSRLARAYLEDSRLAVGEVAYLLGYSQPRAFDRAFRRWTGSTPRSFRDSASQA